jgi:hypothetical protein
MKSAVLRSLSLIVVLLLQLVSAPTRGAAQQSKVDSIIGDVVEMNAANNTARLKTEAGTLFTIKTDDNTVCLRIPAGEKTLTNAVPIKFAEIAVGDRVLGHGTKGESVFLAQRLVVLTKGDIEKKRERQLEDWQRRGIGGIIREVNAQTAEVTLELRSATAGGRVMVATSGADFRRYESESLRFEDARPSGFGELKVGDQLRALGDKSADGHSFKAEKIVSGVFRTIGVAVTEIDLQKNEIKATTLDQKKPIVIMITSDSTLRRIPPPVAQAIAQKALANKTAAGSSTQKGPAAPTNQNIDVQQVIESLPKIAVADLKAGDVLAVTSAVGKDDTRMTAIKLVAGVDLVLKALAPQPGKPQVVRLSAGLPSVFDFSVIPIN